MDFQVDMSSIAKMAATYSNAAPVIADETEKAIRRAVIFGAGEARRAAPVDTARLRSSITHETVREMGGVVGRFGTNVTYAKPVEYGTGLLSTEPTGAGRHWPLPTADTLDGWARRHGFSSGQEVAAIIGRRGGIRPHPYLKPAFLATVKRVPALLDGAMRAVLQRIAAGGR